VVIDDETDIGRRVALGGQWRLEDQLFGLAAQRVVEPQEYHLVGSLFGEWLAADLVAFDAFAPRELVDGAFQRAAVGSDRKAGAGGDRGGQAGRGGRFGDELA